MAVIVKLRVNQQTSYFKEYMLGMMKAGFADRILLSSGFFQENWCDQNNPANTYSVTTETAQDGVTTLLNAIQPNCNDILLFGCKDSLPQGFTLWPTVYPSHPSPYWNRTYYNFVYMMQNAYGANRVSAFVHVKCDWHAKLCIFINQGRPVAGIVGSSNLTRRAFGSGYPGYNIESDVIIYDENDVAVSNAVLQIGPPSQQPNAGGGTTDIATGMRDIDGLGWLNGRYVELMELTIPAPNGEGGFLRITM